jgi:hypothetical protein
MITARHSSESWTLTWFSIAAGKAGGFQLSLE